MSNRRQAILNLALAFDLVGVIPSELRPEAFASERDRKIWRGVIDDWGKRRRERVAGKAAE